VKGFGYSFGLLHASKLPAGVEFCVVQAVFADYCLRSCSSSETFVFSFIIMAVSTSLKMGLVF